MPEIRVYGQGQGPIPSASEGPAGITMGKRFVPAPTPWQAGWNTMLRNYTPWGPFGVDPSPTGSGGRAGMVLGAVPYAGGAFQSILAGAAAREKQGQMVEVPPARSWFQNLLSTIQNTLRFAPGGGAMDIIKPAMSGISGLAGTPEFFGTSWGDTAARMGGLGIRELADRTGILKSMNHSETENESQFRSWYANQSQRFGLSPDPDDPLHYYDWRAAFRSGAEANTEGHWPSIFKREGHPNLVVGGLDTRTGLPTYDESAAWGNAPINFRSRSLPDANERWGAIPQS